MQKNPINEGDSIQEPMTLQDYEDAVSLPDGIYPITDDAGTVLDASVIAYGNRTVEQALTWSYLGQTTGNTEIDIPSTANEVIAVATYVSINTEFHFITIQDNLEVLHNGYYRDNGTNGDVCLKWTKSTRKAYLYASVFAGSDVTASTTTKWYVKG